jgi:hypothetical protein
VYCIGTAVLSLWLKTTGKILIHRAGKLNGRLEVVFWFVNPPVAYVSIR